MQTFEWNELHQWALFEGEAQVTEWFVTFEELLANL
jgi:hypothetical protein